MDDPAKLPTSVATEPDVPARWLLDYGGTKHLEGPEYLESETEAETLARLKVSIDEQFKGAGCGPRRPDKA
jgi:hypothetical protein